jgi:hypothetical protein
MKCLTGAILCVLLCSGSSWAGEITVPDDYPTIQAAIDAATSGDIIWVEPGTYTGPGNRDIRFGTKELHLESTGGPEVTIIDCEGSWEEPHRGFLFVGGNQTESVIDGFSVRNGVTTSGGSGIYIEGASPTIVNCIVESCQTSARGGGVFVGHFVGLATQPWFEGCVVQDNLASDDGGGLASDRAEPNLIDCLVQRNRSENYGGGLYSRTPRYNVIAMCRFVGNESGLRGGGLYIEDPDNTEVVGCQITGNQTGEPGINGRGAGIGVFGSYFAFSTLRFISCTITGNETQRGGGAFLHEAEVTFEQTIIYGNCADYDDELRFLAGGAARLICCATNPDEVGGEGTVEYVGEQVFEDPLFCAPAYCESAPTTSGDYTLQDISPCLPVKQPSLGDPPCVDLIGAYGQGCASVSVPGRDVGGSAKLLWLDVISPTTRVLAFVIGTSAPTTGSLRLYDVEGRFLSELYHGDFQPGERAFRIDLDRRNRTASGVRFLRFQSNDGQSVTRKVYVIE